MKRIILFCVVLCVTACSSFEKSNISGGSVSVEKDGVVVSAEIQTKDEDKTE